MLLMNVRWRCANFASGLVAGLVVCVFAANSAWAVNRYFDVNGTTAGSGVTTAGSPYSWENAVWNNNDATGATATTNWTDGDFPRFSAGTDASGSTYTVNASTSHTFAGMFAQAGVTGPPVLVNTVHVTTSGGAVLSITPGLQGFFAGANSNLFIDTPLSGVDATSQLRWAGGGGSLFLYAANTFQGGVVLDAANGLNFNNAASFGPGPITFGPETATATTTSLTYVLANPDTTAPVTIANATTMRSYDGTNFAALHGTNLIYTGHDATTFNNYTLGTGMNNTLTIGNTAFTGAKMIINNLAGAADSNLIVATQTGANGTLVLTGTPTYGGTTQIGGNTALTSGQPILQADDGTTLSNSSFLILNGGVLQTSGTFTRDVANAGAGRVEWNTNGGGFSAIGGQLTVDIGANNGNAGLEMPWSATSTVGTGLIGPLKFGSVSSNAKVLWIDPVDINAASGTTRTITVTAGVGGDYTEMNKVIRNSTGSDAVLQKNGTGTLLLSAANTYAGATQVSGGALQATDGTGLPTTSLLSLDGGVLEGIGATSFTRPLAGSGTSVQWTALGGGFSATGGQMTVNIGGASTPLVWGTTVGSQVVGPLIFGSHTASAKTLFVNAIDLGAAARTVTVNSGVGGDSAEMSGILSSSGAGSLTKNGAGTLLLSAANSYSGGTTVSAGTLALGNVASLPSTGVLTLGGGTLSNLSGSGITLASVITLSGNSALAGANGFTTNGTLTNSAGSRTLTVSNTGGVTLGTINLSELPATGRTLTVTGAGNVTINGPIQNASAAGAGNGSLTFNTTFTGTATLNGAGTYTGTTTLSTGGSFVLGNKAAFGASTVAMNGVPVSANTDLSGANAIANATVNLGGNNTFSGSNNIEFSGTVTETSTRTVTNNITGASLIFSGPVNLSNSVTNRTLTIAGAGSTSISGVIANGSTSTAGALTKSGAGTLTLSGANTYAGATTISGGTLLANNASGSATGTGAVTVATAGTLGGTGTVSGAVTNNGIIAPGSAGIGTLSVGGNVTDGANSSWSIDLSGATADKLAVTGNIDLSAVDALNVSGAGTGSSWLIGTYTGTLTGTFDTVTSGYTVSYTGGNITLNSGVAPGLPGDYNQNGVVDSADYVLWRHNVGQPAGTLPNDTTGLPIGPDQYSLWRSNFGNHAGAGSGLAAGSAVPEPATFVMLLLGLVAMSAGRRR